MSIRPITYTNAKADEGECNDGINTVALNKITDTVKWALTKGVDCGSAAGQHTQVAVPYSGEAKQMPCMGQLYKNIPITRFNLQYYHPFEVFGNCTKYMVEMYMRLGNNGSRFRTVPRTGSIKVSLHTSIPDSNYEVEKIGHFFYDLNAYTIAHGAPTAPAVELPKIQINPDKPPVRGHLQRVVIVGDIPAALRPNPKQVRWAFLKFDYLHPDMTGTYYFDAGFAANDVDGFASGYPVGGTNYDFDGLLSFNIKLFYTPT
jgi:hypothetical protein